ncbi:MAG TPA: hypothetical protein VMM17_02650, partial [Gemmatimonadaceae bacterium]|nr:hypothetical protein [Gemmatimonadaceae bacterium]
MSARARYPLQRARLLTLLFMLLLAAQSSHVAGQQPNPSDPSRVLPLDPLVTVGTLPNGLHYFIRENVWPANR